MKFCMSSSSEQKWRFAAHWSMTEDTAAPVDLFGRFMMQNRCQGTCISVGAHAIKDETCSGSCVLSSTSFSRVVFLPILYSLDESVLVSTSRRNTTRMHLPNKLHRYGSKMYMVCDTTTAYCHRWIAVHMSYHSLSVRSNLTQCRRCLGVKCMVASATTWGVVLLLLLLKQHQRPCFRT